MHDYPQPCPDQSYVCPHQLACHQSRPAQEQLQQKVLQQLLMKMWRMGHETWQLLCPLLLIMLLTLKWVLL